jgi:hypothetical protein
VRSQVEDYRAKAKEYARLTVVTKSLREGRRYRKLAEMYWALALGEESHSVRSLKMSEIVMTTYPTEFHRRFEQKWERRADAAAFYESTRRMPWLLEIGRTLRAELDTVKQPVSERLAAMLKELERPTAT